jgi:hypothetical protein
MMAENPKLRMKSPTTRILEDLEVRTRITGDVVFRVTRPNID